MTRYEPHCDCLGGHVSMVPDPNGRWCRAEVKPLEWDEDNFAKNPWGGYWITSLFYLESGNIQAGEIEAFGWAHSSRGDFEDSGDGVWPTVEDAKAAAQADYERRILSALVEPSRADEGWQDISTAPHEQLLVLGWYEDGTWKQEIALASAGERFANGYSNRWFHGRATHWMPLHPAPRSTEADHD